MSYANKAAVLLFAFVLAFSFFMAPAAPQRAELASSPELTPEAVEQIDTWYDTLNQPGYTAWVAPLLADWVETGEISEKVVTKLDGSVSALVVVAPWADRNAIEAVVNVEMVMDLKVFTTIRVSIPSADRINTLAEIDGVGLIDSDLFKFEKEDEFVKQTLQDGTPTQGVDMDVIREVVGATGTVATGYTGDGVVVGHVDTGCDFGNPDLQHAYDPGTYDGTGMGMTMSWYHANSTPVNVTEWATDPFNMLTYESGGDIYLDCTGWDPLLNGGGYGRYLYGDGSPGVPYVNRVGFIWLYAYYWGIDPGQLLDYIQEDWKLPDPSEVQGNYSVGWIFQQRNDPYAKFFAPVVVFNATADYENKLILNWEDTMAWMKIWTGGFYYETYDLTEIFTAYDIITTFDFDFTDEFADGEVFDLDNPIVTHDYDGGGDDISFGSLCWGYDTDGWYDDEPIFNGFRSDRDMFCLYFDDGTHGTATATHIAGLGNTYYNEDNETTFEMKGIAPDADILSLRVLSAGAELFGYIWACGFDMVNTTTGEMGYTGNHRADLITNSWGWVNEPSNQFGYTSLTWDILSTPGFLDPTYPGVLHVFSAGNEGSGFMTTGPPGSSPGVLTVGASTTSHWLDYLYGPDQMDYEGIASFSSKGPSFSGYPKPDIVAPGLGGYAGVPWYGHYFNDMWLPSIYEAPGTHWYNYTFFAGTSQAAPVAAGVAALLVEALGGVSNPAVVKNILQYTAVDLGYDPATQGFGRVDAEAACDYAANNVGMVGASTDSWNYFANLIADAWAYSGILPVSWIGISVNQTAEAYPTDNYEGSLFFGQVMAGDTVTNHLSLYDDAADLYGAPMTWGGGWAGAASYMVEAETYTFTSTTFSYNDTVVVDEQMYGYFVLSDEIGGTYDASEGMYSYMTVGVSFDAADIITGNEPWMFLYDWEDLNVDGMPNLWNGTHGSEMSRITSASDLSNTNMMPFGVDAASIGVGLDGDIALVIHDPIHDANQTAIGNDFTCTVIFWTTAVATELAFDAGTAGNTVDVTLTAPTEVGIHLGYATVTDGAQPVKIPYSYTVVANLTAAEGEVNTIVSGYGAELEPYDNAMYGCMEEDPDDWDFRSLVVHNDWGAGYLGIRVIWADTGNDMYVLVSGSDGSTIAEGHGMTPTVTAVIAEVPGDGDYYLLLHPIALNGTLGLPVEYDVEVMWYSDLGTEDVIVSYNANNLADPIVMANGETVVEDIASGDHATVNASFPANNLVNMPEYEVMGTTISFLSGVYYVETTDLVPAPLTYNPFAAAAIDLDLFAWQFVDGVIAGDNVRLEVGFTNADCDIFVYWADSVNASWNYGNNLVEDQMSTGANPEIGSFIADRNGEIAIGCFNFDNAVGTWTLTVDTRSGFDIVATGPEVTYDTYENDAKNNTFQVMVAAVTGTNIEFDYNYPAMTFNNLFTPEMLTVTVSGTGAEKTIDWTYDDINVGDMHVFEVLVSPDSGVSYQLVATNITDTSYVWDSTSFLARDTYRVQVRVIDYDPVESPDSLATGEFWTGLEDAMESSIFSAGTLTETTTTTDPEPTTTEEPEPTVPPIDPLWIGLIAGIGAGVVVVLILFLVKKR